MRTEFIGFSSDVETLLAEAGLPVSDMSSRSSLNLLGVRDGGRLAGLVGIEVYGDVGLLRSLVVAPARRNAGLGMVLVASAETWAAEQRIKTLFLLTTSAANFFMRLGYEAVPRFEAPAAIAATSQFKDLCPASSTFMRKALAY